MSSVYSVGVGGGGPAWRRGLGNLQTVLGALEERKQRRRRQEATKRAGEMSKLAWTVGTLPAASMMGLPPGVGMALGPFMGSALGSAVGSAMRGPLEQMLQRRAAPGMSGRQPPAAGGGSTALLMNLLRRNPQLGSLLAGPRGRGGDFLPLLSGLLAGIPAGIGRFGGQRRGGQPPYGPFKLAI